MLGLKISNLKYSTFGSSTYPRPIVRDRCLMLLS